MNEINKHLNIIRKLHCLRQETTLLFNAGVINAIGYYAPWEEIWQNVLNDNEAKP